MARYILIDNNSGYIWGDSADLEGKIFDGTPAEFAKKLDESLGTYGREYDELSFSQHRSDTRSGYRVYRADVRGSDTVAIVQDGRDQDMIDAVERDCAEDCFISIRDAE
jgi:hypothetical protein